MLYFGYKTMKMKRFSLKYLALLAGLAFALTACKPEEIILDPPPSKLEGINGTFTLEEVIQVDLSVLGGDNSLDVTSVFSQGNRPSITFNSSDFTYTYSAGDGPDYIGTNGSWAFDNNEYPTLINMNYAGSSYELKLLHTIRPQDAYLEVSYARTCGGSETVVYEFKFARN
jgi:hypothetical protein